MSHPNAVSQRQTNTVEFAPGACEKALVALGFDGQRLRDDDYLCALADDLGGAAGLKAMAEQYQHLTALSRPKLFAELVSRMTTKEWAAYRDMAASLPESELIQDAMRLEFRRRHGFWTARVVNVT